MVDVAAVPPPQGQLAAFAKSVLDIPGIPEGAEPGY